MSVLTNDPYKKIKETAKKGYRGHPLATIAFYGATNKMASKCVVGVFKKDGADVDPIEKWFSETIDVRNDDSVGANIVDFIKSNQVKSVIVTDGIIGCPHEKGIDYPLGESCPQCPYWAGRNRWTGKLEH